jgi:hypothetical protein
MLSKVIRERIEKQFGQEIRYSKDCEVLATAISSKTNKRISASTLKRLFGLAKGIDEPRLYTMDVIAMYLDFKNFDELHAALIENIHSDFEIIDELKTESLKLDDKVTLHYEPNRKLTMKYLGNKEMELIESVNSKLKINDKLIIPHIVRNYPLLISEVIRQNKNLGPYTAAKISGVTSIIVH